jgi:hypothetical protein
MSIAADISVWWTWVGECIFYQYQRCPLLGDGTRKGRRVSLLKLAKPLTGSFHAFSLAFDLRLRLDKRRPTVSAARRQRPEHRGAGTLALGQNRPAGVDIAPTTGPAGILLIFGDAVRRQSALVRITGRKSGIALCPKSARSGSDKPIQIVSSARTRRDAETLVRGRTSLPGTSAVLSCRLGSAMQNPALIS